MSRTWRTLVGIFVLVSASKSALGWNATGHQQIADIAWTQLTPFAKAQIREILMAGDPEFRPSGPGDAALRSAFRNAANFADHIKSHEDTIYESEVTTFNVKWQPNFDPHTTDREAFRCKTWHYYDTPIRFTGTAPTVRASNALVALDFARDQLAGLQTDNQPDRRMQCWWLYWIEHLVGDLHQPLHCTSSYEFSAQGDNGGNGFKLGIPDPAHELPLHSYWDSGIDHAKKQDREAGLSTRVQNVSSRWSTDPALAPTPQAVQILGVPSWIDTGAQLADQTVYHNIQRGGKPDAAYDAAHVDLCRKQAVLAGFRLAAVLNAALFP